MKPYKSDYEARTVQVELYSYYERFEYDGWDENEDEEDLDYKGNIKLENLNLQILLDMLPSGVKPEDVKITSYLDVGSMSVDGHKVVFYYNKEVPADPEGYQKACVAWEKYMVEWEANQAVQEAKQKEEDIKKKQQEIRALKERLAQLKK